MHLLDERKAADARSDDDAEALAVTALRVQAGVIGRHLRGHHRVVDEGVGLLDFLLVDPLFGIEAVDLAGDPAGKLFGVELRDRPDARPPFHESLPGRLIADAERGDHPQSCDDDAALVHREKGIRRTSYVVPLAVNRSMPLSFPRGRWAWM